VAGTVAGDEEHQGRRLSVTWLYGLVTEATHMTDHGFRHYFDHERLEVYQLAKEFARFVQAIAPQTPRGRAHLKDQLIRASDSMGLNIAEGASRRNKARTNHYEIALASCAEASSALDYLVIAGLKRAESGQATLHVIAPKLARLIQRLR
jgi:four helix bundle protein